ncbi:MAG: signal peptidase II [Breznakia sp.]
MKHKKRNICLGLVFLVLLAFDQVIKYIITQMMSLGESIPIIDGFFNITRVHNTGGGWSILEGQMLFFYVVTVFAFILLWSYLKNLEAWKMISRIGIVIALAGIMGNFIDRLLVQYVVDFLDFTIIGYRFPTFNVADICIVIGIGLVFLEEILIWAGVETKWTNNNSK